MVRDGFEYSEEERGKHQGREAGGDDDGWLRTGGMAESQEARVRDVRTVDEAGNMGERMEEEDDDEEAGIPDMEDEEDDEEAIIRDPKSRGTNAYVIFTIFLCSLVFLCSITHTLFSISTSGSSC